MKQGYIEIWKILRGLFSITLKMIFGVMLIPFILIIFIIFYLREVINHEASRND